VIDGLPRKELYGEFERKDRKKGSGNTITIREVENGRRKT
jgi:hypothetical protein